VAETPHFLFATFPGEDDQLRPVTLLFYARQDSWEGTNGEPYDYLDEADDERINALVDKYGLDYVMQENLLSSRSQTPAELHLLIEGEPDFSYDVRLES
jgi:hypothetical protein